MKTNYCSQLNTRQAPEAGIQPTMDVSQHYEYDKTVPIQPNLAFQKKTLYENDLNLRHPTEGRNSGWYMSWS